MIKFLVILLICGIIYGQDAPTAPLMRRGLRLGNRPRQLQRLNTLASLVSLGGPRLSKRNLPHKFGTGASGIGTNPTVEKIFSKLRKSFAEKRNKARPSRGLKYYFNLATPNGNCGCGGGGQGNVNCKCDNKITEQQNDGKE